MSGRRLEREQKRAEKAAKRAQKRDIRMRPRFELADDEDEAPHDVDPAPVPVGEPDHLIVALTLPSHTRPIVCIPHGAGGLLTERDFERFAAWVRQVNEDGDTEPQVIYLAWHAHGSIPTRVSLVGASVRRANQAERALFKKRSRLHRASSDKDRGAWAGMLPLRDAIELAEGLGEDEVEDILDRPPTRAQMEALAQLVDAENASTDDFAMHFWEGASDVLIDRLIARGYARQLKNRQGGFPHFRSTLKGRTALAEWRQAKVAKGYVGTVTAEIVQHGARERRAKAERWLHDLLPDVRAALPRRLAARLDRFLTRRGDTVLQMLEERLREEEPAEPAEPAESPDEPAEPAESPDEPAEEVGLLRWKEIRQLEELAPEVEQDQALRNARANGENARIELDHAFVRVLTRRLLADPERWRELNDRYHGDPPYRVAVGNFLFSLPEAPMQTETEKGGACCKSCAAGRPCEGSCPNHRDDLHDQDHDEQKTLWYRLEGPPVLRRFGNADLLMVEKTRTTGKSGRQPTLRVPTAAGLFTVHMFMTRDTGSAHDGLPRLHVRGPELVFGRIPAGTSVRIVAEESSRYSDGGPLKMEMLHIERSDGRVPSALLQSQAHELVRQVHDLVRPHLPALQDAYEWVRAEDRLEEVEAELERLTAERASLQARLTGHRPW